MPAVLCWLLLCLNCVVLVSGLDVYLAACIPCLLLEGSLRKATQTLRTLTLPSISGQDNQYSDPEWLGKRGRF
jgi:hypothetical protein